MKACGQSGSPNAKLSAACFASERLLLARQSECMRIIYTLHLLCKKMQLEVPMLFQEAIISTPTTRLKWDKKDLSWGIL